MGDEHTGNQKDPVKLLPFTLESLIGRTFDDRYVIDELIGMGAMGAVFRARQIRLRRTVAIKVPKPQYCTDREFLARFEREALSMAKLIHEHVVQTIDVFISEDPATPSFIAMEYVEGIELEKFLRSQEEKLTVAAVTELFCQIARGIDAAHARGIVHRDIKPSNIIVTMPHRVPKIMDFGIARVEMEDVFATTEEAVIGTPAFMAPEQIKGGPITSSADIYAFGMTLYRLLTRNIAFQGGSSSALLYSQANDPPIDIIERNPLLPNELRGALMPALAKDPAKRPSSGSQLANEVKKALEPLATRAYSELFPDDTETVVDHGRSERRPAVSPLRRLLPIAAALLALLLISAAAFVLSRGGQNPAKSTDTPDDSLVQNQQPPTPPVTPEPTAPPPATVQPPRTEAPQQTPALETPRPQTPAPTQPPPATTRATRTPRPTPTQAPSPTPSPSPAPETQAPRTPATDPAAAFVWDPAEQETLRVGRDLRRAETLVKELLSNRIERPVFHRQWDRVVLNESTSPLAPQLLAALRRDADKFNPLEVRLIPVEQSHYWRDRALVRLNLRISGKPVNHPEKDYRQRLFSADNAIEVKVLLAEDGARLLSFSSDNEALKRYLLEGGE